MCLESIFGRSLTFSEKSDLRLSGFRIPVYLESMKTTIDIPDAALADAMRFTGAKTKREAVVKALEGYRLVESKKACAWLAFDEACWTEAAATARACLRAGVKVPLGDVLVYACATRHGVELLERDRHFAMIRKAMK
jgi:Arc/MetJ family transcription regulator